MLRWNALLLGGKFSRQRKRPMALHYVPGAMTIQIFGTQKCKRTRAAERFFKERRVRVQMIELSEQNLSPGEFDAVKSAVGLDAMVDREGKEFKKRGLHQLSFDLESTLREHPALLMTPVVRHGAEATVGAQPNTWKAWVASLQAG